LVLVCRTKIAKLMYIWWVCSVCRYKKGS